MKENNIYNKMRDDRRLLMKFAEWLNENGYFNTTVIDWELAEFFLIESRRALLCGDCVRFDVCNDVVSKMDLGCQLYEKGWRKKEKHKPTKVDTSDKP